jgi:DNA repair ATPase RecN
LCDGALCQLNESDNETRKVVKLLESQRMENLICNRICSRKGRKRSIIQGSDNSMLVAQKTAVIEMKGRHQFLLVFDDPFRILNRSYNQEGSEETSRELRNGVQ